LGQESFTKEKGVISEIEWTRKEILRLEPERLAKPEKGKGSRPLPNLISGKGGTAEGTSKKIQEGKRTGKRAGCMRGNRG